jgi:hypothetical protein
MTKIAYFISAYKNPESVIRLINALADDSDLFYIHFDKNVQDQTFGNWRTLIEKNSRTKNITIRSEFRIKWGSFDVPKATLNSMNYFEGSDYDYFINLTGECYPLQPISQIKGTFTDQDSGFMTFWKMPYEGWYKGGMDRINNHFFFLPQKKYPYVRKIGIPRLRRKLPFNLKPYGGWALFCLPKELVSYVLEFLEENPSVKSFFKHTFAPGEMMFQTILMNSQFRDRIVNDNKRYVDFVGSHPRILTKEDYSEIKNSGKLFGRKFDPTVDDEILNFIDREITESNSAHVPS